MNLKERIMAFLGHSRESDNATHAKLDAKQNNIASRLSKLTGQGRDEVLAEAYRRADRIYAERLQGPERVQRP